MTASAGLQARALNFIGKSFCKLNIASPHHWDVDRARQQTSEERWYNGFTWNLAISVAVLALLIASWPVASKSTRGIVVAVD